MVGFARPFHLSNVAFHIEITIVTGDRRRTHCSLMNDKNRDDAEFCVKRKKYM
jgi:hypothetical protein